MYSFKESDIHTLKYVKAGKAGKILSLTQKVAEDFLSQSSLQTCRAYFEGNHSRKDTFIVIGESMAQNGIHTGDLLFVSLCEENEALKYGTYIVLKVDENRLMKRLFKTDVDLGYKLRKFLMTVDLEKDVDEQFVKVKEIDEESHYSATAEKTFKKKFKEAVNDLGKVGNVLLSVTYTDNGRDFSFHMATDLYAKVDMVYTKENNVYELKKNLIENK